ncbi:MAG: DUF2225 domain-containing protein [Fibrobacterota bacterium]
MAPPNVKEVKRRLNILLDNENLVNTYIRKFGPQIDMKNIKEIKENSRNKNTGETSTEEGEDPIFTISLICPVCGAECTGYELRGKSQQITFTLFNVPVYKGAMGFRTVNYNHLAVTVCTRCFFASPDKRDFSSVSKITKQEVLSQIPTNPVSSLQEKIGERKSLASTIVNPEDFFRRPRDTEQSILSYRLSVMRARVEAYFDMPYSYYKLGSYFLKIANLQKANGENESEALKEALNYFSESFSKSDAKSEEIEYQVIYNIIALHLKAGNQAKANSYISAIDKIKTDKINESKQNPGIVTTTVQKWVEKCKRLWEDRDDPSVFENT